MEKEKQNLIDLYCNDQDSCNGCMIQDLCEIIEGDFQHYPDKQEKAYQMLKRETERQLRQPNNVDHPKHYNQGDIECIDAMISAFGTYAVYCFCICNSFKYIWRHQTKHGTEDLDKAIWYSNKALELMSIQGDEHDK